MAVNKQTGRWIGTLTLNRLRVSLTASGLEKTYAATRLYICLDPHLNHTGMMILNMGNKLFKFQLKIFQNETVTSLLSSEPHLKMNILQRSLLKCTTETLKIGTPKIPMVTVLKLKWFRLTMQKCIQMIKLEWQTIQTLIRLLFKAI